MLLKSEKFALFFLAASLMLQTCMNGGEEDILQHKRLLNLVNQSQIGTSSTAGAAGGSSSTTQTSNFTATVVYGQPNFSNGSAGVTSATTLNLPIGIAFDSAGNMYISDNGNNRVLYYTSGSTTASIVYGQSSMTGSTANAFGASSYTQNLSNPKGISVDSAASLLVADAGNYRVVKFTAGTTVTFEYGQGTACTTITNAPYASVVATQLNFPTDITYDSAGQAFVADQTMSRVMKYGSGTCTATNVYGQLGSYTSSTANISGSVDADGLNYPVSVATDSAGNLYVADLYNNRVLKYPSSASTTAIAVYGQSSFSTNTANQNGISASSLKGSQGIYIDSSDNLYVADSANNRVLYFPSGSTTATKVYGQSDFATGTSNTGGISAKTLSGPADVAVNLSSGAVCIADQFNNRVLCY